MRSEGEANNKRIVLLGGIGNTALWWGGSRWAWLDTYRLADDD